jgi:hypothetical protein
MKVSYVDGLRRTSLENIQINEAAVYEHTMGLRFFLRIVPLGINIPEGCLCVLDIVSGRLEFFSRDTQVIPAYAECNLYVQKIEEVS